MRAMSLHERMEVTLEILRDEPKSTPSEEVQKAFCFVKLFWDSRIQRGPSGDAFLNQCLTICEDYIATGQHKRGV